eukprot:gb/GECH01008561.1/.p1 GENE.gb/GECH01008561.1/~~gb/GECH01008561.1/.p1  ORF type:complete len:671 (+),score=138.00 gb/GECH01008561.1/:1-2013(+)
MGKNYRLYGWGTGYHGHSTRKKLYTPEFIDCFKNISFIDFKYDQGGMITDNGALYLWGDGKGFSLGTYKKNVSRTPHYVKFLESFVITQCSWGSHHTLALTENGQLFAWGDARMLGQHYKKKYCKEGLQVQELENLKIVNIASGIAHNAVVTSDGIVYTWGCFQSLQLIPKPVTELYEHRIVKVACGESVTYALDGIGKVYIIDHPTEIQNHTKCTIAGELNHERINTIKCAGRTCTCQATSGNIYHKSVPLGLPHNSVKFEKQDFPQIRANHIKDFSADLNLLMVENRIYSTSSKSYLDVSELNPTQVVSWDNVQFMVVKDEEEQQKEDHYEMTETQMGQDFKQGINNPDFSDVTLVVQGKKIFAHKAILAWRSRHFRALFLGGMKESTQSEIEIPSISYSVFLSLLEYMYTGTTSIKPENLCELYIAADQYLLTSLADYLEQELIKHVSSENCVSLLFLSERHSAKKLKKQCINNAAQHLETISKHQLFENLPFELKSSIYKQAGVGTHANSPTQSMKTEEMDTVNDSHDLTGSLLSLFDNCNTSCAPDFHMNYVQPSSHAIDPYNVDNTLSFSDDPNDPQNHYNTLGKRSNNEISISPLPLPDGSQDDFLEYLSTDLGMGSPVTIDPCRDKLETTEAQMLQGHKLPHSDYKLQPNDPRSQPSKRQKR